MKRFVIRLEKEDNVVIARHDLEKGRRSANMTQ